MKLSPILLKEDKSAPAYASAECQQLLAMYEEFYPKTGFIFPWVGYFVIKDDQIVGSCSFVGQPTDGRVEIAYWTFKEFEGKGVASFACRELISIAMKEDPEVIVTAKTAPEKNASTRILEKNNFVYSEIVQDDEIGDAWLWIYDINKD